MELFTCYHKTMIDVKEKISMRYFLRNTCLAKKKIQSKKIVLLENKRDNTSFVLMTLPKYEEMFHKSEKPTIKNADNFIASLSGKWDQKIQPESFQRNIRSEWEKK